MHQHEKKLPRSIHPVQDGREPFGARLRRERERRQISIASIADSTKILGALLEGLEKDDVSRWPLGFYRRAFLRSYASAIGLDPEATWREFAERFPEHEEAIPAAAQPDAGRRARLRLRLADRVAWFAGGPVLERTPPRLAAVAFDVAVINALAICCFVATGHFWLPLSVAALCYYCGGVLLLGNAPGVCLFAPAPAKPRMTGPSSLPPDVPVGPPRKNRVRQIKAVELPRRPAQMAAE